MIFTSFKKSGAFCRRFIHPLTKSPAAFFRGGGLRPPRRLLALGGVAQANIVVAVKKCYKMDSRSGAAAWHFVVCEGLPCRRLCGCFRKKGLYCVAVWRVL